MCVYFRKQQSRLRCCCCRYLFFFAAPEYLHMLQQVIFSVLPFTHPSHSAFWVNEWALTSQRVAWSWAIPQVVVVAFLCLCAFGWVKYKYLQWNSRAFCRCAFVQTGDCNSTHTLTCMHTYTLVLYKKATKYLLKGYSFVTNYRSPGSHIALLSMWTLNASICEDGPISP